MISKEEVKHIAKLARLGLTEKEIAKYQKELSSILDYIEKLKEVDVSGVEPTSHSVLVENIMRGDESQKSKTELPLPKEAKVKKRTKFSSPVKSQKLLELAPETKDGYLKVKSIL